MLGEPQTIPAAHWLRSFRCELCTHNSSSNNVALLMPHRLSRASSSTNSTRKKLCVGNFPTKAIISVRAHDKPFFECAMGFIKDTFSAFGNSFGSICKHVIFTAVANALNYSCFHKFGLNSGVERYPYEMLIRGGIIYLL